VRQALSVLVVVLALAGSASATPSGDLDAARKSFRERDWDRTVKLATSLIYPSETLNSPDDLVEAHVLLGASKYELGDPATAKTEFEKALEIERDRELTHNVFSDGVVQLFDDTKAELERQDHLREQQEKDALKQQQVENFFANARLYEAHPYYINFFPFGAGQFLDHRRLRGILFASSEVATLGVSAGIWFYLVGTYGISASNVPLSQAQTVRTLQQVEIGTGIAFFGLYAFGVVDALLHYRPRAQMESDDSLLPPELRPKKPKKTSLLERIHIVPMASRTGAGLGLGWEN
jgi:hypothetical protein